MSIAGRFSLPTSSPRIALACAILWATTTVGTSYFPQVFEAREGCHFRANGAAWVSEVRVFGCLVDKDEESANGFDAARTRIWRWRITVALALVGATLGALIGGHRWWRWRLDPTRRPWMKWVASGLVFLALAVLGLPWSQDGGVFFRMTDPFLPGHPPLSWARIGGLALEAVALALVAAMIGWAAQTVVISWGIRPWGRPTVDQAADYDDRTSPSPLAP